MHLSPRHPSTLSVWSLWLTRAGRVLAVLAAVLFVSSGSVSPAKILRYSAGVARRDGKWEVRAGSDQTKRDGAIWVSDVTLLETVDEIGFRLPTKGRRPQKKLDLITEHQSKLSFEPPDLRRDGKLMFEIAAQIATQPPESAVWKAAQEINLREATPELGPQDRAAALEAVLAYFTQERPDLVDRLRRREWTKVVDRTMPSPAVLAGLAMASAGALFGCGWWIRTRSGNAMSG